MVVFIHISVYKLFYFSSLEYFLAIHRAKDDLQPERVKPSTQLYLFIHKLQVSIYRIETLCVCIFYEAFDCCRFPTDGDEQQLVLLMVDVLLNYYVHYPFSLLSNKDITLTVKGKGIAFPLQGMGVGRMKISQLLHLCSYTRFPSVGKWFKKCIQYSASGTVIKALWEAVKGLTETTVSVFFLRGLLLPKQRAILLLVLLSAPSLR